jgi:hypothetical protein
MVKHRATFDTVRRIGLELPGVEDGTAYGNLALKAHGKLLACVPTHRSAEPGSIVARWISMTAPSFRPRRPMATA